MAEYSVSVSEGIVFGDSPAETARFPVDVAEGIVLGDAPSETGRFPAGVAEGVVFGDAPSETARFPAGVSEGVVFGDSPAGYFKVRNQLLAGLYRQVETALARWELWIGEDAAKDPEVDNVSESFVDNPHDSAGTIHAGHDWILHLRKRSQYNLIDKNVVQTKFTINGSNDLVTEAPSNPYSVTVVAAANGNVRIRAIYNAAADAATVRADRWKVYVTSNGVDPVVGDLHTTATIAGTSAAETLDMTTTNNYADGLTIKVVVAVMRNADSKLCAGWTVYSATANTDGPTAIDGEMFLGGEAQQ
jgi:hypothetical protein